MGWQTNFKHTVGQAVDKAEQAADNANSKASELEQRVDEAIADTEAKVVEVEQRVDSRGDELEDRVNNAIAAGTVDLEVKDARGGFNVLNDRLDSFAREFALSKEQTKMLSHGMNILESDHDTPSAVKVEFYGNTLVNLLGRKGLPQSISDYSRGGLSQGTMQLVDESVFIESDIDGSTTTGFFFGEDVDIEENANYLILAEIKTNNANVGMRLVSTLGNTSALKESSYLNSAEYSTHYLTLSASELSQLNNFNIYFRGYSISDSYCSFNLKKIRIFKIESETYDKIGDLSLTGDDQEYVEKAFPYVDSVQHVKNPVVKVEGANLLPPFTEWDLHEETKIINPYEIELDAKGSYRNNGFVIDCVPSASYSFTVEENGRNIIYDTLDKNNTVLSSNNTFGTSFTINTEANARKISIKLRNTSDGGVFRFKKPMLNIGSIAKPFTEKNDSYLYAETVLAGLPGSNEKDNLKHNESANRWDKIKWFETDEELTVDGNTSTLAKDAVVGTIEIEDAETGGIVTDFTVSGRTITWGETIPTSPVAHYQLTKSEIVEDIPVYGDLAISGDAQVEVTSGFDVIENEDGTKDFELWTDRSGTANLTEVIATYQDSMKSSFGRAVKDISGAKTDISLLNRQMLRVLVGLKENNIIL